MKDARPLALRRAFRSVDAAIYLAISETKFRQLVSSGRIPQPKRIDGVVTWDIRDLDSFYDDLPRDGERRSSDWDDIAL